MKVTNFILAIVLFLLMFLLLCSCAGKQARVVEEIERILQPPYDINLEKCVKEKPSSIPLSEIAKSINYIPLETTSSSLLKRVFHYAFFDDNLMVTDMRALYQFSRNGKFVAQIGRKGQGPEDYLYIYSIVKDDSSDKLYLLTKRKMIIYDKQLNFIESVKLNSEDNLMLNSIMSPSGEIISYLGSIYKLVGDTSLIYSLSRTTTSGHFKNSVVNTTPLEASYPGMVVSDVQLYRDGNEIKFMDYGSDTLCVVTEGNEKIPYAICALGTMKRETNIVGYGEDDMKKLASEFLVSNICEDGNFLYITVDGGEAKRQYVLFDKKTGETRNLGKVGLRNDLDGGISFFPQRIEADGTMVMWMPAEEFIEQVETLDYEKQKEQYGDKFEDIWQLASSRMSAEDNHVFITAR